MAEKIKMPDIRVDVGVDTIVDIDLQEYDFTDAKEVIFTIKNAPFARTPAIVERKFSEPGFYIATITAEESMALTTSAEYDFTKTLDDGRTIKITNNGRVVIREGVGGGIR